MTATLLCVDDNHESQKLIVKGLSDDYQVLCAESWEQGLCLASSELPGVILLDVNLQDRNGYQLCEELRARPDTEATPVIFVSGMTSLEDRLNGYRAGGDDYICKPVDLGELRSKIELLLARSQERHELKLQLQYASSTAMTAMTTNGETGAVLNFIIDTYQCQSYEELADKTFAFLVSFGLNSCLQIRTLNMSCDFSSNSRLSPLESQILASGAGAERIVNVSNKSIFNESTATLLIKNMPVDDDELLGRMRDNIALALKGIDARANTLRLEEASREQRNTKLGGVIQMLREQMADLDQYFGDLYQQMHSITDELIIDAEYHLVSMGLSSQQETQLLNVLRDGNIKLHELHDRSSELDNRFLQLEASIIEATLM